MRHSKPDLSYYDEAGLSAAFYDLLTRAFPPDDPGFYADLAGPSGASVLELGCGTARVAIALARQGHTVVGVDNAVSMLVRARIKCERLAPAVASRITLLQADMTDLDLRRAFDAVIVPFFGFAHLPNPDARAKAIGVIGRHLRPGGRAAIHLPPLSHLTRPIGNEELTATYSDAGDRVRIRPVERGHDPVAGWFRQVVEYTLVDPAGTPVRSSRETLTYHWVDDAEIEAACLAAGLRVTDRPGSFANGREARLFVLGTTAGR